LFDNLIEADNSSGFTALGGGYISSGGGQSNFRMQGLFYSSSPVATPWNRRLQSYSSSVTRYSYMDPQTGFSVRCLRD
jgi:hypothetical protein